MESTDNSLTDACIHSLEKKWENFTKDQGRWNIFLLGATDFIDVFISFQYVCVDSHSFRCPRSARPDDVKTFTYK